MGGTKNRAEKMKKSHVYSSGGGGSSKGPAVIDKRNQELQCPYCEKVFKQSERYKNHVAKHEADQGEAAAGEDTVAAGVVQQQAEAVAAPSTGDKDSKAASSSQAGMMQVNSKAGYYNSKSPKLMLHEWVISKKRPRVKYKTYANDGEGFSCRVILPDPKPNGKNDLIVHLPRDLAVDTEEEAEQLGALAAMAERDVMGGRMLHLVLPKQFVPIWQTLEERREKREAAQAKADERAAALEKRKRSQAARGLKAPQTVVMSEEKQQLVQTVLQQVRGASGGASGPEAAPQGDEIERMAQQLQHLGFSDTQATAASQACPGAAHVDQVLNWLLLHLPRSELPTKFRAGSASNAVSAVSSGNTSIQELMKYGYRSQPSMAALKAASTQGPARCAVFHAHVALFSQLTGLKLEITASGDDRDDGFALNNQIWQEEIEVLEAIYGGDFYMASAAEIVLKLHMADDILEQLPAQVDPEADSDVLLLSVTCLHTEQPYPQQLPLIALQSSRLSSDHLLHLTRRLAQRAVGNGSWEGAGMLGEPMVHQLATEALEALPKALEEVANPCGVVWAGAQGLKERDGEQEAGLVAPMAASASQWGKPRSRRATARQDPVRIAAESERLQGLLHQLKTDPSHQHMQEVRRKLPAFSQRNEVIQAVSDYPVVIITGATGCGKSTQVPQFILEDAIVCAKGGSCNIVVTQPRRIAALGLASRVSDEMGQEVGQTVGYSVKSQSATSSRTHLLFCTTGVILRRLLDDRELQGVTHIVVDEVHERSVEVDMMLLLLRDMLAASRQDLKVVLMSATAEAQLFADYMASALRQGHQGVKQLTIPGFSHPVRELYLEDVLTLTKYTVSRSSRYAKKQKEGSRPSSAQNKKKARDAVDTDYSQEVLQSLEIVDEEQINYDLLETLICYIVEREAALGPTALLQDGHWQGGTKGANAGAQDITGVILVFLPGAGEIGRLLRQLEGSQQLLSLVRGKQGLRVLPLHGALSASDQSRIFGTLPKGVRKIVLATNVAETSITIEGVTVVVDCGKVRETKLDEERGIQCLQEQWISQAEAQQRRGRAGRVRPGACFRVFSCHTWQHMAPQQQPAILRMPLHTLALTVRALFPTGGSLKQILSRALTPPKETALEGAVMLLREISALDADEHLNPLGEHLKQLPLDPQVGKMLVYAVMLGCLDHALTVAAAMGYGRPLFLNTQNSLNAEGVQQARQEIWSAAIAARSDHLAIVLAFNTWLAAKIKGGKRASSQVCKDLMLSDQGMESVQTSRAEYAAALADQGFVDQQYVCRIKEASRVPGAGSGFTCDANCHNTRLLKSAVCAGFYPHILRVQHPPAKYQKVDGGAMRVEGEASKVKFFDAAGQRAFIHPASSNFSVGTFESGWLVYSHMVRTSKVYVRESSAVPVYSMLLFGASDVQVSHEQRHGSSSTLVLDGWAEFKAPPTVAVLVKELRAEISRMLDQKIQNPLLDLTRYKTVHAMIQLLSTDGF